MQMPYRPDNRTWIHENLDVHVRPDWNKQARRWEIARPHFRSVVEALAERFGAVDVTIDSRSATKCDSRCRGAEGDDCECQCLGQNHGGAQYQRAWQEVGETTLIASDGVMRRRFRVFGP